MKPLPILLSVLLIVSIVVAGVGWKTIGELRAENQALQAEIESAKAQPKPQAPSPVEAPAKTSDQELQKPRDEASEVQKLREELNQLRSSSKEIERLKAENRQLRNAFSAGVKPSQTPSAPPVPTATPLERLGRERWLSAGFSSPEAALVTMLWAMREGNYKSYVETLSSDEQQRLSTQNKTEQQMVTAKQNEIAGVTGMRILEKQAVSPTEITITIFLEGAGRTEKARLTKAGSDWRFGGFVRAQAQ